MNFPLDIGLALIPIKLFTFESLIFFSFPLCLAPSETDFGFMVFFCFSSGCGKLVESLYLKLLRKWKKVFGNQCLCTLPLIYVRELFLTQWLNFVFFELLISKIHFLEFCLQSWCCLDSYLSFSRQPQAWYLIFVFHQSSMILHFLPATGLMLKETIKESLLMNVSCWWVRLFLTHLEECWMS